MKVLTVGTFDVPHMGHALMLLRAAQLGELVVGLNTDEYTEKSKKKVPFYSYEERKALLLQLPPVTQVIPNSQNCLRPMLILVKPDILVIGSDWGDRYFEQIQLTKYDLKDLGVTMVYLPYTQEISTSSLTERIRERDIHSASR